MHSFCRSSGKKVKHTLFLTNSEPELLSEPEQDKRMNFQEKVTGEPFVLIVVDQCSKIMQVNRNLEKKKFCRTSKF